jgi:hypothetical protein
MVRRGTHQQSFMELTAPLPALLLVARSPTLLNIYTGKQVTAHQVTLVPEVGKPVHIIAPNVYVRKATLQGINGVLTPYGLKTSSSSAGRRLLQWGGGSGLQRSAANNWASQNTADAIAAAASGRVPTGFATNYGQQQVGGPKPVIVLVVLVTMMLRATGRHYSLQAIV